MPVIKALAGMGTSLEFKVIGFEFQVLRPPLYHPDPGSGQGWSLFKRTWIYMADL
jgi:hypothetical protein